MLALGANNRSLISSREIFPRQRRGIGAHPRRQDAAFYLAVTLHDLKSPRDEDVRRALKFLFQPCV